MEQPNRDSGVRQTATDAARRSRLASERTYLSWWRTGLSAFGLCIAIGGLLPALTSGSDWLLVAVGAAFGLLGVLLIAHGQRRHDAVDRAIERDEVLPPDGRERQTFTLVGALLGVTLIVMIVVLKVNS